MSNHKPTRLLVLLILGACDCIGTACADAESAWSSLLELQRARPRAALAPGEVPAREYHRAVADWREKLLESIAAFAELYPQDPRRLEAIAEFAWFTALVPEFSEIDPSSRSGWKTVYDLPRSQKLQALLDRLAVQAEADPALPIELREKIEAGRLLYQQQLMRAQNTVELSERRRFRTSLDAFAAHYPDSPVIRSLEEFYVDYLLKAEDESTRMAHWRNVGTSSPSAEAREHATARLAVERFRHQPVDLRFTAIDGREVDLARLRGKVVLIDFWGTLCKPCIAELPNLKRVYKDYQARGFEIVGIACDQPNSGDKLREFVQRNDIPWPQFYDGKFWRSEMLKRFAVTSLPSVFLLDQSGKLITTDARGDKLEAEVKRLLKL